MWDMQAADVGFAVRLSGTDVIGQGALAAHGAQIGQHIRRYDGIVETWLDIRAEGRVRVENVEPLSLRLPLTGCEVLEFSGEWGAEFEPIRTPLSGPRTVRTVPPGSHTVRTVPSGSHTVRTVPPGSHTVRTTSGRSSHGRHPFLAALGPDGALAVAVMWSGNWHVDLSEDGITAGVEVVKDLAVGESFESPHIAVCAAPDLNEVGVLFGRAGRRHWYPGSRPIPNEWNHWWTYEDSRIDERTFLRNAVAARRLGIEASTLDAGWFGPSGADTHWGDHRGDWDLVNTARFPRGIAPLAEQVHALGMRFGIWCEIEAVGSKAALRKRHPDFLAVRDGKDLGYVCFANPRARAWAELTLRRLIGEGADWIKLDFNLDPGAGCNRIDHGHGSGDGLFEHYRSYYETLDRIRADHPGVILENCSSGGLRIDLEMLRHTDVTFLSDPDWPEHGLTILWAASLMLAPERLLHWGFSEWGPTRNPYQTFDPYDRALTPQRLAYYRRIAMLGSTGCSIGLADLPEWVARELAGHNRFYARTMARFVREGDLRRLTDQPGRDGTGERWAGFQYTAGAEHLIAVFRLPGGEAARTLCPLALEPERAYTVQRLDARTTQRRSGAELMRDGLAFTDLREENSEIVLLSGE